MTSADVPSGKTSHSLTARWRDRRRRPHAQRTRGLPSTSAALGRPASRRRATGVVGALVERLAPRQLAGARDPRGRADVAAHVELVDRSSVARRRRRQPRRYSIQRRPAAATPSRSRHTPSCRRGRVRARRAGARTPAPARAVDGGPPRRCSSKKAIISATRSMFGPGRAPGRVLVAPRPGEQPPRHAAAARRCGTCCCGSRRPSRRRSSSGTSIRS